MKIVQTRQRGVALLIVLFMVSFMLIFVAANAAALFALKREIRLVDQQQRARWASVATNAVEAAKP